MRIEDDIKLDYSDVLIRPKRSTLTSRYGVDMNRILVVTVHYLVVGPQVMLTTIRLV